MFFILHMRRKSGDRSGPCQTHANNRRSTPCTLTPLPMLQIRHTQDACQSTDRSRKSSDTVCGKSRHLRRTNCRRAVLPVQSRNTRGGCRSTVQEWHRDTSCRLQGRDLPMSCWGLSSYSTRPPTDADPTISTFEGTMSGSHSSRSQLHQLYPSS